MKPQSSHLVLVLAQGTSSGLCAPEFQSHHKHSYLHLHRILTKFLQASSFYGPPIDPNHQSSQLQLNLFRTLC